MMQTAARPSWLLAACLTLGLADLLFLNLVVFPRTSLLAPAGDRLVATREETAPAPVAPVAALPRERVEITPPPVPTPAAAEDPPAPYGRIAPAAEEPEAPQAILFATGIARLDREGREVVDRLAAKLADLPSATLLIDGHADRRGEEDFNRRLSRARAQSVMRRLASQGVPRSRLMMRGFGSRRPAVNSADPDGLRRNRRVEISVRRSTS